MVPAMLDLAPTKQSDGVSAWIVILIVLAVAVALAVVGYLAKQRRGR